MATRETLVKGLIRKRYARHALGGGGDWNGRQRATDVGYARHDLDALPPSLVAAFAGCGNLLDGVRIDDADVVVDLGAGAGLDALLISRRTRADAVVVAVDLTPEMLAAVPSGSDMPHPVAADFEKLPLADGCCDLVVSNAGLNLALDPAAAYAEIFRVLRPGGRLHICDLVRTEAASPELLADPLGWSTSLGGVLYEPELVDIVRGAGFIDVSVHGHRDFPPVVAITLDAESPPVRVASRPQKSVRHVATEAANAA